jgi:hypothetical protein
MMRLPVHSRSGNWLLAVLGSVYTLGAIAVLTRFVIDVWSANSLADGMLQFAVVAAGMCGVWFVASALENLGVRHQHRSPQRSAHR